MSCKKLFTIQAHASVGYRFLCFFFILTFSIFGVLSAAREARAQVTCRAEVRYEVTRAEQESPEKIVFRQEEARGDSEELVREALSKKLILSTRDAMQACREQHENLSGCVASKYTSLGSLMQQMPFAARTKLQEAIEVDCKARMGTCVEPKVPEMTCVIPTPVTEVVVEGEAGSEKETAKKPGKK